MKDIIVCRCEGVRLSEIVEAIGDDASSMPGIKKRVRAGMGFCQGRVCQPVIADILKQTTSQTIYQRAQSPVRPIRLIDLIDHEEDLEWSKQ